MEQHAKIGGRKALALFLGAWAVCIALVLVVQFF
jgi:hypothetical protein